jgi:hypothetical protein
VLAEPKLLKLNFGIMCLHIITDITFVALPGQLGAPVSLLPSTGKSIW